MLEESDLDLLTRELRPAQNKWESIGCQFFYTYSADFIRDQYSDDGDRLRKMLSAQLKLKGAPTVDLYHFITWRNIVDGLRSPDIGESQLADELEVKYCPSELLTI